MNLCINKSQHAPAGLSETEPNPVSQCGIRSESEPGPVKPIRIRTWPGETDPNPNPSRRNRSESDPIPAKPIRIRTPEGQNRSESELRKINPNPGLVQDREMTANETRWLGRIHATADHASRFGLASPFAYCEWIWISKHANAVLPDAMPNQCQANANQMPTRCQPDAKGDAKQCHARCQ